MSVRVKKNFAFLRALETATPRTRRAIISTSPRHIGSKTKFAGTERQQIFLASTYPRADYNRQSDW
jgi:hypothetical protein